MSLGCRARPGPALREFKRREMMEIYESANRTFSDTRKRTKLCHECAHIVTYIFNLYVCALSCNYFLRFRVS